MITKFVVVVLGAIAGYALLFWVAWKLIDIMCDFAEKASKE